MQIPRTCTFTLQDRMNLLPLTELNPTNNVIMFPSRQMLRSVIKSTTTTTTTIIIIIIIIIIIEQ
jgi:hypothetical protein